jgi:hypothetical protein
MSGFTSFLRCANCHNLYVASDGFHVHTAEYLVYWAKPKARRKPSPCDHPRMAVEIWNGTGWEAGDVVEDSAARAIVFEALGGSVLHE